MFQRSRSVAQVLEFSLMHIGIDGMLLVNDSFGKECCHLPTVCSTRSTFKWKEACCNQTLKNVFGFTYIISGFPAAIAHVAGPSLAPRLRKTCTT